MSLSGKHCRIAYADATLLGAGAAITTTWKDPDTIDAAAPTVMELEYVPKDRQATRITAGAAPGVVTVSAVTKLGCTVTPAVVADTGVIRVRGAIGPEER